MCQRFFFLFGLPLSAIAIVSFAGANTNCRAESPAKTAASSSYSVEMVDDGVEIKLGGQLLTKYWASHTSRPILWPLIGFDGVELTRGYPMQDALPSEKKDHVHHRSFWFNHGEVNGLDFWSEAKSAGKISAIGSPKISGGDTATLKARHQWNDMDGNRVLTDQWHLTFAHDDKLRWIDCVFTLTASEGDVNFGDTKEGSFGIRVAGTMKVDAKQGGKIRNAEGLIDSAAWAQASSWVDYYGPVSDGIHGIAILNHPDSFNYPTRWHVRTYGLFAANPFGVSHFVGGSKTAGTTLKKGESMTFGYRVVIHRGDTESAGIPAVWEAYRATKLAEPN